MHTPSVWELADILRQPCYAEGGEPNGRYTVRTVALLHHEGDCDSGHEEEADEVMDPIGNTIAYFLDSETADFFCAFMNRLHGFTC